MFGTVADHICISRLFAGMVGGGIHTCMSLYLSEIADDHIRGKLGTSYQLSRNLGILFAYILGMFMNYIQMSKVFIGVTAVFAISFVLLPATPKYLLQIGADDVSNAFRMINLIHFSTIYFRRKQGPH